MWSGALLAQDFTKGFEAYKRGDYATSLQELQPLAEQGNALAQGIIGIMYEFGQGVPQDYAEAAKWFRLAAEQGDAEAQFNLANYYFNGYGVIQDYEEAAKLYRFSAEQGKPDAQSNLAVMYVVGYGVIQDYVKAHMWGNIAASQGNERGSKIRDLAADRMTPDQIAEAQRLARECVAADYKGC